MKNGIENTNDKGQNDQLKEKTSSASEFSLDLSDLKINKQTIDLLIANVIPTTKYFESRFDHMQFQIDRVNQDINIFKLSVEKSFDNVDHQFETMQANIDQRFEAMQVNMDQRFEKIDQRFEKIDQRFEKVDQRFEKIIFSIDRLTDKLDGRDERQRNFTLRMFTIAVSISIIGVMGAFLKSLGII